jgi:hypothetical protein
LLSTTNLQRGQSLAIFSIALSAVIMVAALAFDGGMMMLERRDQQNAADAAAIAAARFVRDDSTKATAAAINIAGANGFTNGINAQSVKVNIPPTDGPNKGRYDYVEVEIASTRPSIFAGIMNVASWPVSARAVATDLDISGGEFSILALDPTGCDAMLLSGNGDVTAYGNIQVNSTCTIGALRRQGGSDIYIDVDGGACNVVGDIKDGGGQGLIDCVQNEGAPHIEDPLLKLPAPSIPVAPLTAHQITGSLPIPDGCPGSASPATYAAPAVCQFQSSYKDTVWRLFPGLYPGGLKLQGGTFYLEPGIYYIGGGGIDITGNDTDTFSVAPGGTTGPAGGVMFYNTEVPSMVVGPVVLNGASADINLLPFDEDTSPYDGILLFQDRALNIDGDDITINGSDSDMELRGTIYVPAGDVMVNGSAGKLTMDQVIAFTYKINGAPGSQLLALKDENYIVRIRAAGLVE